MICPPTLSHTCICPSHNIPPTNRPLFTFTQRRRPLPQLIHRDIRLRELPLHTTALEYLHRATVALHHAPFQHHHPTRRSSRVIRPVASLALLENAEAQADFGDGDDDGDDDEHNDNPGDGRHLGVGNGVRKDLGEVQEDTAAFVEDLDPWVDLEVVADSRVQWGQGRLGLPKEVGYGEDV